MDRPISDVLPHWLETARAAAAEAAAAILPIAGQVSNIEHKDDGSPLTRADRASHDIIVDRLTALTPEIPILSEEGDLDRITEHSWETYWCVDPLDGTKEFIRGLPEYTVNIALVSGGRPILGVVDIPSTGVQYFATAGQGAWRAKRDGEPMRIAPSNRTSAATAVVSRSHLDERTQQFLRHLGSPEMIQHGSSLKITAVADGRADIYPRFGPTCLWDTAAGVAVALVAGCIVIDLKGTPLRFKPDEGIKQHGFIVVAPMVGGIETALREAV